MKNKQEIEDNLGLFIPAGIFIGWGFGILIHHWFAGFLLGLGAGFVILAIAHLILNRK